jgi:dephospho-CoA kinase
MPTIKISDKLGRLLEEKRRLLLSNQLAERLYSKLDSKRVEVTIEDVIIQNFKDIETLNDEVTGLIKQLQKLGVRPYWTEEKK